LVIEIDGNIHDKQVDEDIARQQELESQGYRFLRFTNETVLFYPDRFIDAIRRVATNLIDADEGEVFA